MKISGSNCAYKIIFVVFALTIFIIGSMLSNFAVYAAEQTYTVTYAANGSSGGIAPTDTTQYVPTDAVTVAHNTGSLTRDGYIFGGWMSGNKTYHPGETINIVDSDVILYAVWVPAYTITYNGNESAAGTAPTDTFQYTNGSFVKVMDNTGGLNKDFGFKNWNTKPDGSGAFYQPGDTFRMGSENVTLYAMYNTLPPVIEKNYNAVTYYGNGNTDGYAPVDNTQYPTLPIILIGSKGNFTVQGNIGGLIRNGYAFNGWNTKADGTGATYQPGDVFYLTTDLNLYVLWVPVYIVTYDSNGGMCSSISPNQYPAGTKIKVIDAYRNSVVKLDKTFVGWNTNPYGSGTTYSPDDVFTLDSDITLYAMWKNGYDANNKPMRTVTYYGCGNTEGSLPPIQLIVSTQTVTVTVQGQGTLKKNGYIFDGWCCNDGNTYKAGDKISVNNWGVMLFANWVPTLTVSYQSNDATSGTAPVDNNTYAAGVPVTIAKNSGQLSSELNGHFVCWNTKPDGSGKNYNPGEVITITDSLTLYAIYSTIIIIDPPPLVNITPNVIYYGSHADGGAVPTDSNHYANGATITVLGNTGGLYKSGYDFVCWSTKPDGSGTKYIQNDTLTFPQNDQFVALFAIWQVHPTESIYMPNRIDYSPNGAQGGWVPASYQCEEGQIITVSGNIGNLYKKGSTFCGWIASFNGVTYKPNDTLYFPLSEGVVTMYAAWQPYPTYYKVKYVTGSNVTEDPIGYEIGDNAVILSTNYTKPGYYFSGWTTGDGKFYQPGDTISMLPGLKFTAVFEPVRHYFVTYNGNGNAGGTPPDDYNRYKKGYYAYSSVTVAYDGSMIGDAAHFFVGWNAKADGSGITYKPGDTFTIGAANITLYAMWKPYPNLRSVIYIGNGSTGGTVPLDKTGYLPGSTVTLANNSGNLTNNFAVFYGWWVNGKIYKPGNTFTLTNDTAIYAVWGSNIFETTNFSASYNGNDSTSGSMPIEDSAYIDNGYSLTIPENSGGLVKTGYVFNGWTDGINIYQPGESYYISTTVNKVTFYAIWAPLNCIIYDGNGSTGGAVPADSIGYKAGTTVALLDNTSNLTKTGYTFSGWWINGTLYRPGSTITMAAENTAATAVWVPVPAISTPLFYDSNNSPITVLPTGTVNCKFTITNNTDSAASPVISIAAYNCNLLVNLQIVSLNSITINAGDSKTFSIVVAIPVDCDYIKFLGFKNADTIEPATMPTKITVQE